MSRFADDSLGTVVNTEGSGGRATTPQMKRTTPRRQRQTTPQRAGSAPRSSSASKVSSLAKACFDAQSCNRSLSRTAGRRKQQKWENDNLFGLNMFMKKVYALNKQRYDSDYDSDEGDNGTGMSQGLSLNWQSLFSTLSNGENEEALEAYLRCSNSYRVKKAGQSKSVRECYSEWDRAEFAWLKVEKRLRTILLRALSGVEARQFVEAVEALLLHVEARSNPDQEDGAALEQPVLPPGACHLFARSPRLVKPSKSSSLSCRDSADDDVVVSVEAPHLVVTLVDSAFHRLLLHATCQFHNMHSKSFNDKKHNGARATRISPYQSQKCRHTISLVPFVLLKISSAEEDNSRVKKAEGRKSRGRKNKENDSDNTHVAGVVSHKVKGPDDSAVVSLDDLMLEEKGTPNNNFNSQVQLQHQQLTDEMPVMRVADSKKDDVRPSAEVGDESLSDDDDDEYCLVGLVASSTGHSNPIESREESL